MPMFIDSGEHKTRLHSVVAASMIGLKLRGRSYEGEEIVKSLHRNGYDSSEENLQKVSEIIEELQLHKVCDEW